MNLSEKVIHYWHVPTASLSFQKLLIHNRNTILPNSLSAWFDFINKIKVLSSEEQELLEKIILRIEPTSKEFTLNNFFKLTSQVVKTYHNDRYVLLKYNQFVNYDKCWNEFYLNCRGVVIDLEEMEVCSASLTKFFNLDENEFASSQIVKTAIIENGGVSINYDKADGSNINVSFKHELLVSSPGAFSSPQALSARNLLETNHNDFVSDLNTSLSHLTFVFELVGPDNRIIVLYEKSELILLHVINSNDGSILSYDEMLYYSQKYNFTPCSIISSDLNYLLSNRENSNLYKATEQEGWVIRIDRVNQNPLFVKIKCSDYLSIHRAIDNAMNPKWVLNSLLLESFDDDFSSLDNEQVRNIVSTIADVFYSWNRKKKDNLSSIFSSVDSSVWLPDEVILKQQHFVSTINELTKDYLNQDSIRKFLVQFSKGKTSNPKEEILSKANQLFELNLLNLDFLSAYQAYSKLISFKCKDFISEFKNVANDYIYNGIESDKFKPIFDEFLSDFYHISKDVEKLDYWLSLFEKNEVEFYRFVHADFNNLKPNHFGIATYCKKKIESSKVLTDFITILRSRFNSFFFERNSDDLLSSYFDNSLIINDSLFEFYLSKSNFEENTVREIFPNISDQEVNSLLKEFYLICNGQETDNSYSIAKELFEKIEPSLSNQIEFFKAKGQFSSFVNKSIRKEYRSFIFELFVLSKEQKEDYLNNINFLEFCSVIIDPSKEKLEEFDVDFRNIDSILSTYSFSEA